MSDYIISENESYISSRTNPAVKSAASLQNVKSRRETGRFLAEGVKLAEEAACAAAQKRISVNQVMILEDAAKKNDRLVKAARRLADLGADVFLLSAPAFDKITSEKSPQGIAAVCEILPDSACGISDDERVLILDSVQDPGNLGTVIRSAAALGWNRVYLISCADSYSPKALRASMGAVFRMKIFSDSCVEAIKHLMNAGRRIVKADIGDDCITLGNGGLLKTDCLVIGNEGHGISDAVNALCSTGVCIPMKSGVESLNAAAAAAIMLWEYSKL